MVEAVVVLVVEVSGEVKFGGGDRGIFFIGGVCQRK